MISKLDSLAKHKAALKKARPKFLRQNAKKIKRVSEKWRKPRGFQSKMRKYKKGKPRMAAIGFKSPRALQGILSSGFKEKRIFNVAELKTVDPKTELAVIGATVGKRKTLLLIEEAKKLGIKFSNIDPDKKKKEIEDFIVNRKKVKVDKKKKAAEKKKKEEKEAKKDKDKSDKKNSKSKIEEKPQKEATEEEIKAEIKSKIGLDIKGKLDIPEGSTITKKDGTKTKFVKKKEIKKEESKSQPKKEEKPKEKAVEKKASTEK